MYCRRVSAVATTTTSNHYLMNYLLSVILPKMSQRPPATLLQSNKVSLIELAAAWEDMPFGGLGSLPVRKAGRGCLYGLGHELGDSRRNAGSKDPLWVGCCQERRAFHCGVPVQVVAEQIGGTVASPAVGTLPWVSTGTLVLCSLLYHLFVCFFSLFLKARLLGEFSSLPEK